MNIQSPVPGPGHNNPPPLRDRLASDYADMLAGIETLADRANHAPKEIGDDAALGPVSELVKDISAAAKRAEACRVDEKEPHLQAGREVDGFFKTATDRLSRMKTTLEGRVTTYLRAKADAERKAREEEERRRRDAERVAREEADRKLREAEEADRLARMAAAQGAPVTANTDDALARAIAADEAAEQARRDADFAQRAAEARSADLARTRGAATLSTLRTTWEFEIVSEESIPLEKLRAFIPRGDIEKAVRAFVRAGHRDLPGVRIYQAETAVIR
jgi:hypothetical protein